MGPIKQIQRMMDQHRIFATVTYLAAIVATLVVAFKASMQLGGDFGLELARS